MRFPDWGTSFPQHFGDVVFPSHEGNTMNVIATRWVNPSVKLVLVRRALCALLEWSPGRETRNASTFKQWSIFDRVRFASEALLFRLRG